MSEYSSVCPAPHARPCVYYLPVCRLSTFAFAILAGTHFLVCLSLFFSLRSDRLPCPDYLRLRRVRLSSLVCVGLCNLCAAVRSVSPSFGSFLHFIDLIVFGLWICLPIFEPISSFEARPSSCPESILGWMNITGLVLFCLQRLHLGLKPCFYCFWHNLWDFNHLFTPGASVIVECPRAGGVKVLFSLSMTSKGND